MLSLSTRSRPCQLSACLETGRFPLPCNHVGCFSPGLAQRVVLGLDEEVLHEELLQALLRREGRGQVRVLDLAVGYPETFRSVSGLAVRLRDPFLEYDRA